MNIANTPSNMNFNGRYYCQTEVLKRSFLYRVPEKNGAKGKLKLIGYKPVAMNVVEVEKTDEDDNWALKMLLAKWGKKTVLNSILISYDLYGGDSVFCVTTQEKGFEKLNPGKIQGVIQAIDSASCDSIDVERVQTKPSQKYIRGFEKFPFIERAVQYLRKYHGIGKSMMDFASDELAKGRKIELFALKNAKHFYEKNGFRTVCGQSMVKDKN